MTVHDIGGRAPLRIDPRPALHGAMAFVLSLLFSLWSRAGGIMGATMLGAYFAVMLGIDWLRPVENWDTLAYVAAAARDGFTNNAELHAYAYEAARQAVSPEAFASLTQMDAYRQTQFADPDAFVSMLGMYEVKWLYVQLVGMLAPLTGPWHAGFAINVGAALLAWASICRWLGAMGMLRHAPVAAGLFIVGGAEAFAMSSIPDFLTIALMLAGVLALDRDRVATGVAALVLAVLTRPDSIAFVGVLMAAAWYFQDRLTRPLALAFALSVAAYLFVQGQSHHPGWWSHLWFSTYHIQNTMEGFAPDFSLRVYLTAFAWNAVRSVLENTWAGLYLLALAAWAVAHSAGTAFARRRTMLLAALMAAIAAKFVIFPLHDGRTYLPLLLPAMLVLHAEFMQVLECKGGRA